MMDAEGASEAVPMCAADIEESAADWLARRVSDDWNEEEQAKLNAWRVVSPAHHIALLRLDGAWNHTYRLSVLRGSAPEAAKVAPAQRFRLCSAGR